MLLDKIRNLPKIIILKIEIARLKAFLKRNSDRKASYHRHFNDSCSAYFQCEDTNKRRAMEETIKKIIKTFKNSPQALFSFVEKENTKVYRINFVKRLLDLISEKEGFIPPKTGVIAIYLNLITEKKFSSETNPMFIFDKNNCDYYEVLHQFYRWYSYKMDFPGFSQSAISKFHKLYSKNSDIELSLPDIDEIQEVLKRDIEAGLFVLQLSKEQDGSKQVLDKIKQKNKVAI